MLNIKKFRGEQSISISKLAKRAGVTRSYICELEKGTYDNPGLKVICKLCIGLGCTPNDLIPEYLYQGDLDRKILYGEIEN